MYVILKHFFEKKKGSRYEVARGEEKGNCGVTANGPGVSFWSD